MKTTPSSSRCSVASVILSLHRFRSDALSHNAEPTSKESNEKCLCWCQGFDNFACNIVVLAHTTPPYSRDFGTWRQALLTELERIVRKHGAHLNHLRQV